MMSWSGSGKCIPTLAILVLFLGATGQVVADDIRPAITGNRNSLVFMEYSPERVEFQKDIDADQLQKVAQGFVSNDNSAEKKSSSKKSNSGRSTTTKKELSLMRTKRPMKMIGSISVKHNLDLQNTGVRAFFLKPLADFVRGVPMMWAFDGRIPYFDTFGMRYRNLYRDAGNFKFSSGDTSKNAGTCAGEKNGDHFTKRKNWTNFVSKKHTLKEIHGQAGMFCDNDDLRSDFVMENSVIPLQTYMRFLQYVGFVQVYSSRELAKIPENKTLANVGGEEAENSGKSTKEGSRSNSHGYLAGVNAISSNKEVALSPGHKRSSKMTLISSQGVQFTSGIAKKSIDNSTSTTTPDVVVLPLPGVLWFDFHDAQMGLTRMGVGRFSVDKAKKLSSKSIPELIGDLESVTDSGGQFEFNELPAVKKQREFLRKSILNVNSLEKKYGVGVGEENPAAGSEKNNSSSLTKEIEREELRFLQENIAGLIRSMMFDLRASSSYYERKILYAENADLVLKHDGVGKNGLETFANNLSKSVSLLPWPTRKVQLFFMPEFPISEAITSTGIDGAEKNITTTTNNTTSNSTNYSVADSWLRDLTVKLLRAMLYPTEMRVQKELMAAPSSGFFADKNDEQEKTVFNTAIPNIFQVGRVVSESATLLRYSEVVADADAAMCENIVKSLTEMFAKTDETNTTTCTTAGTTSTTETNGNDPAPAAVLPAASNNDFFFL